LTDERKIEQYVNDYKKSNYDTIFIFDCTFYNVKNTKEGIPRANWLSQTDVQQKIKGVNEAVKKREKVKEVILKFLDFLKNNKSQSLKTGTSTIDNNLNVERFKRAQEYGLIKFSQDP
jgi:hypothetical protein